MRQFNFDGNNSYLQQLNFNYNKTSSTRHIAIRTLQDTLKYLANFVAKFSKFWCDGVIWKPQSYSASKNYRKLCFFFLLNWIYNYFLSINSIIHFDFILLHQNSPFRAWKLPNVSSISAANSAILVKRSIVSVYGKSGYDAWRLVTIFGCFSLLTTVYSAPGLQDFDCPMRSSHLHLQ